MRTAESCGLHLVRSVRVTALCVCVAPRFHFGVGKTGTVHICVSGGVTVTAGYSALHDQDAYFLSTKILQSLWLVPNTLSMSGRF